MEKGIAVLQFMDYSVRSMQFDLNVNFVPPNDGIVPITPEFSREIIKCSEKEYEVCLVAAIRKKTKKVPFSLKVAICGLFVIHNDDNALNDARIEDLLKTNATAILFPYLRSVVSTLTTTANIPPFILPTLNFNEILEEEEKG